LRRPDALDHALGLRDWAALAEERDLVSPAETRTREQSVDLAASGHRFRYSFSIVITSIHSFRSENACLMRRLQVRL
jgi:hypothetical protein